MRRKLFTIAAGVSAVLFVGVCALWVRSYWRMDRVRWAVLAESIPAAEPYVEGEAWFPPIVTQRITDFRTLPGYFEVSSIQSRGTARSPRFAYGQWRAFTAPAGTPGPAIGSDGIHTLPGAAWSVGSQKGHWSCRLFVRAWVLVALSGALPAWVIKRLLRQIRRRSLAAYGCCTACGYDLRATPDRCPECGAVPAPGPLSF